MSFKPRYPIYVPSKARSDKPLTARMFDKADVPYFMVVQPDQVESYAEWDRRGCLLVLPEDDKGLVYARNWIKEHSIAAGNKRHWQFDDDISRIRHLYRGHRLPCDAGLALAICEDFVDRYENVAVASLNSDFFVVSTMGIAQQQWPPFYRNGRCYTDFLVLNSTPNRWRHRYNEDTDMSLQVLADGWCTILFNTFLIQTEATKANATNNRTGGGQAAVYAGDGRLKMARELERVWPGTVETRRRFDRPQHFVRGQWKKFDNELVPVDPPPPKRNYDLRVRQVADEVKSPELRALLEEQ